MSEEWLEIEKGGKQYRIEFSFSNVEITPSRGFPVDLRINKEPIEIKDGDRLASSVEINFRGKTLELLREAEKIQRLPEEVRLTALVELIHTKLEYPYPEVQEIALRKDPTLKEWFNKRFGKNPDLLGIELNEFLDRGYGDCKVMSAAYIVAAQSAGLKGIFVGNATILKNVIRPDNGQPIFRSVEAHQDLKTGHAWVEIQLSDGRWIPVDPTTGIVGLDDMLDVFRKAGYKVRAVFADDGLPKELELDRGDDIFDPGQTEKDLHLKVKIGKDFMTKKPKTDHYTGQVNLALFPVNFPKGMNLDFRK